MIHFVIEQLEGTYTTDDELLLDDPRQTRTLRFMTCGSLFSLKNILQILDGTRVIAEVHAMGQTIRFRGLSVEREQWKSGMRLVLPRKGNACVSGPLNGTIHGVKHLRLEESETRWTLRHDVLAAYWRHERPHWWRYESLKELPYIAIDAQKHSVVIEEAGKESILARFKIKVVDHWKRRFCPNVSDPKRISDAQLRLPHREVLLRHARVSGTDNLFSGKAQVQDNALLLVHEWTPHKKEIDCRSERLPFRI